MDIESKTTIDELFELKGANREAKAYAFLWAAFRRTEISSNPVRDALDCLVPFIAPYTNQIAGKQVTANGIQTYLKENFGFDIPLYAVDQLIQALTQQKYVQFRQQTRTHVALSHVNAFDVVKSEIETEFDDIADQLEAYAKQVGFTVSPPPSGSWGHALIAFLRVRTEKTAAQIVKVKGALIDPSSVEMAIVGTFIRKLHTDLPDHFEKIVHIFMGVLIEDFISSVTEIGQLKMEKPVTVFYDTAVLLRQLGCSGKALKVATEELTQYLQDLGMKIHYLSGNEQEVDNILNTIVHVKDTGGELEGETAAAIADGEVTTTSLRMLRTNFPEQLARFNIFPAGNLEANAAEAARYQIDEAGFAGYLLAQARKFGRQYSQQNRQNDAGYLAWIMRLRRGNRARDLADCGYVFITPNMFLAHAARRFLIEQKMLGYNNFPPIISLGQAATIAWLLKDQTIPPEKAGRELLANCFAAVKPDAEWFKFFREGIEQVVSDSLEDYATRGSNALTVTAARRIAQEESFGSSTIVRQLNMAEILSRAEAEQQRLTEEQAAQLASERERAQAAAEEQRHKADAERSELIEIAAKEREQQSQLAEIRQKEAVEAAVAEAKRELAAQLEEEKQRKAHRRATFSVNAMKGVILLALICVVADAFYLQNTEAHSSTALWVLSATLAVATVLAFADLLKFKFMEPFFDWLHARLARIFRG